MEAAYQTRTKIHTRFIVAAYELDHVYGGPEEGGWWYNTGTRVRILKLFNNEEDAYTYCRRFNSLLRPIQRRNRCVREISSVIYDGGMYEAQVYKDTELPAYYPTERPYYE